MLFSFPSKGDSLLTVLTMQNYDEITVNSELNAEEILVLLFDYGSKTSRRERKRASKEVRVTKKACPLKRVDSAHLGGQGYSCSGRLGCRVKLALPVLPNM